MIIVGLGNPGKKYNDTPHNIGFEAVDRFVKENNFPDFNLSKKFKAQISEKGNIILAKPETFMNSSGKCVSVLVNFYKEKELVVIHDDIDLELGKIRISKDRGSAGHKGVESIIKELGTKDFTRIRIGIKPKEHEKSMIDTERYVLKKFEGKDKEISTKSIKQAVEELKKLDKNLL